MSEYVRKQALLERIEICEADSLASASDYDMGMARAFRMIREQIQSGAFDVDESEGTWKATSEFAFRLNDQLEAEIQRLRAALEEIKEQVESYGIEKEILQKIWKFAYEALSTTTEPPANVAKV